MPPDTSPNAIPLSQAHSRISFGSQAIGASAIFFRAAIDPENLFIRLAEFRDVDVRV
jgi:hypothetical protein